MANLQLVYKVNKYNWNYKTGYVHAGKTSAAANEFLDPLMAVILVAGRRYLSTNGYLVSFHINQIKTLLGVGGW